MVFPCANLKERKYKVGTDCNTKFILNIVHFIILYHRHEDADRY